MPSYSASSPRRLATSAQVHPKFLPLPAVAAVACIGYAAVTYQTSHQSEAALAAQESHVSAERERMALLDAYGGRDSLEELEMAARLYEAQQNQGRR